MILLRRRAVPIAAAALAVLCLPLRAEEPYPALAQVQKEVERMIAETRASVVSVVTKSRLELLLEEEEEGDRIRVEILHGHDSAMARRVGSGVVIDDRGHIATLTSVVSGAAEVFIVPADGRRLLATIVGADERSGLAVLSTERGPGLRPVQFGDAASVKVGSLITVLGVPLGEKPTYSLGFVSGSGIGQSPWRRGPYLELNAWAAPGSGGGPVFDTKGRLVGLLFGARSEGQGLPAIEWEAAPGAAPEDVDPEEAPFVLLRSLHRAGSSGGGVSYAVPSDVVQRVTDQIIRTGTVRRPWLGVTIESHEPGEVRLTRIVPEGPASRAGLQVGDRIVAVDGARLASAEALVERISQASPGEAIRLRVARDGRERDLEVRLGDRSRTARTGMPAPAAPRMQFRTRSPQLGVQVKEADAPSRRRLGLPEDVGLQVTAVQEGSRAGEAGLREGDLIVEALGSPIRSIPDLRRALRRQEPGRSMDLTIFRGGRRMVLPIPPFPEPPLSPAPPAPPPRP